MFASPSPYSLHPMLHRSMSPFQILQLCVPGGHKWEHVLPIISLICTIIFLCEEGSVGIFNACIVSAHATHLYSTYQSCSLPTITPDRLHQLKLRLPRTFPKMLLCLPECIYWICGSELHPWSLIHKPQFQDGGVWKPSHSALGSLDQEQKIRAAHFYPCSLIHSEERGQDTSAILPPRHKATWLLWSLGMSWDSLIIWKDWLNY